MKEKKKEGGDTALPRGSNGSALGVNTEIGRRLKQYYDEILSEAVPERFDQLLRQLEQAEPTAKKDA